VRHTVIESPHHYNQPMREAMYGWMTLHLKGEGDGSPIPEPMIQTEEPEVIRCFPGEARPEDYLTIPRFAAAEARRLLDRHALPTSRDVWATERAQKLAALAQSLGPLPTQTALAVKTSEEELGMKQVQRVDFDSEPGVRLFVRRDAGGEPVRLSLLLNLGGMAHETLAGEMATGLRRAGWTVAVPQLRGTGPFTPTRDSIGNAPDHNSAEWALWVGRPLLGQWAWDVRRALDAILEKQGSPPQEIMLAGQGPAALVALVAATFDARVTRVIVTDTLASYLSDQPYRGQRLGLMVPGLLRDVGDVAHIAALVAPRPLTIGGGVTAGGTALDADALRRQFEFTRQGFALHEAAAGWRLTSRDDALAGMVGAASPGKKD
jgi:hypothetical protein